MSEQRTGLSWTGMLILCLVAALLGSFAARQVRHAQQDCERSGGQFVEVSLWQYECQGGGH